LEDQQLRKYFEFDEGDLNANRNGYLTPKQQTRLAKEAKAQAGCSLFLGILLLGVAVVPILILYFSGAFAFFGAAGLVWLIWPIAWGTVAFFRIRGSLSKPNIAVQKAEGPINIVKTESYSSSTHTTSVDYELHVGGQTFDVDSDLADYMMQGDIYAIHYTQDPREIISVEQLTKAK
jgi:hypothetical protein